MHWFKAAKGDTSPSVDEAGIAREISALSESPQWQVFKKEVEKLILAYTPDVDTVRNADHAIEVASRLAFISGVKRVLGMPEQYKQILKSSLK